MKNQMVKLIILSIGIMITFIPLRSQNTDTNPQKFEEKNEDWDWIIGTCGMYPNDAELRDNFKSYFGIQGEAQKKIKDDIYLGVNAVYGFGSVSYTSGLNEKARQTEFMPFINYKIDKFEIGAGPVLTNLKIIEEYNDERDDFSISGLGLGGKAKYTILQRTKIDIAIFGAYSKVAPGDDDIDIELGATKFGLFFLFK